MKAPILFLLVLTFAINIARSQTVSFTYRVENTNVITKNTSNLTFSEKDTFIAYWYFQGDGNMIFENFDSASFIF
jgi:hypothetical protein